MAKRYSAGGNHSRTQGDLVSFLDQLKDFDLKQFADAALQIGRLAEQPWQRRPVQNLMPISGGSFGKYGDLGAELKSALLSKFQEMQLLAEFPASPVGNYSNTRRSNWNQREENSRSRWLHRSRRTMHR